MKQLLLKLCLLIALLSTNAFYAQNIFSANKGRTAQKKYYTTIPYKEVKTKVIIQCLINGKPYNFIVDTGAITTISPALHKELNLQVIKHIPVRDQSGRVDSLQTVSLKNVQLGDVTFNDIPTVVAKESEFFDCFKVDGFIGSNMLRNSIVQFASQTKLLTITNATEKLHLNNKVAINMITDPYQSNPYIKIDIIDGENTGTEELLFDSGMDNFYDLAYKNFLEIAKISPLKIEAEAVGSNSLGIHGPANEEKLYRVFIPELIVNGYLFKNITTITTHGSSSRIGAPLFKYGVVTLDYINKKFYFEPYQKDAKNLAEKSWPFIPTVKEGKVVIGLVWDKAWEGKINTGDILVSFDGETYEDADVCDVLTTDHSSANSAAVVVLKDAATGAIKQYEVTR